MRASSSRFLLLAMGICGAAGIAVQTALMRELVVAFYGNELTTGFLLGVWLLGTAFGSGVLGRRFLVRRDPGLAFVRAQLLSGLLAPLSLLLVRFSPRIFGHTPGEISDLLPMLLSPLLWVFPLCALLGFLFAAGVRAFEQGNRSSTAAKGIGWVYFAESIGAAAGGLITSLVLLRWLSNLTVVALAACLQLGSAAALLKLLGRPVQAFGCAALAVAALASPLVEQPTLRLVWRDLRVAAVGTSIYGQTVVTELDGSLSFYVNGLLMATWPDYLTAEQVAHIPLLAHPAPRRVLLVGGGASGLLQEILKHPSVEHVDYVELDPTLIRLARRVLPDSVASLLDDPRVSTHHVDGRRFLRNTRLKYDVILLNLPDPHNVQVNRFYSVEFFREARTRLLPGGLLAFEVNSSENAINNELAEFLRCLQESLQRDYRYVVVFPGETAAFLASPDVPPPTTADTLVERLRERGISAKYVREYYLPYRLSSERKAYLREKLVAARDPGVNHDLRPVAYYFDVTLWSTLFTPSLRDLLRFLREHGSAVVIGVGVCLLLLCLGSASREWHRTGDVRRTAVLATILTVGFAEISIEILAIVAFQAFFGYAYHELALLVAAYMVGLTVGSLVGTRAAGEGDSDRVRATWVQLGFLLLLFGFLGLLEWASASPRSPAVLGFFRLAFPGVVALAGAAGGYQFPVANAILLQGRPAAREAAGLLYSIDLAGSSAGALVTSAFLVPIAGVQKTLAGLVVPNLLSLMLLAVTWTLARRKRRSPKE
ncbi:MAG: fused MFS/spermidine synthase [candidate division KSB1 bacterium]|nr:fused MFS/spermidine synthase [candidate division KSB1 bacterium]